MTRALLRPLGSVLWPVAVLSFAFHCFVIPLRDISLNSQGYDMAVWWGEIGPFLRGIDPYLHGTVPSYYNYPPSMLLFVLPLGLVTFQAARVAFLVVQVVAILVGGWASLRLFELDWRSGWGAAMVFGLSLAEPVVVTLGYGNAGGLVFPVEALMLLLAARGQWIAAGVMFGIGLAIKPVLLPLVIIFMLRRKWRALAIAAAVPLALSAVTLAWNPHGLAFFTVVLPSLGQGVPLSPQGFNTSLAALSINFHVPVLITLTLRAAVLALAGWLIWRKRNEWESGAVWLVEVAALAMLASFLSFSFSWFVYAIYLIPFIVSAVHPASTARSPLVWLGVYAAFTADHLSSVRFTQTQNQLLMSRYMLGFCLMFVAFAVVTFRRRHAQSGAA